MAKFVDSPSGLGYTVVSLNNRVVTVSDNDAAEASQAEFDKRISTKAGSTFATLDGESISFTNRAATLKKLTKNWQFICDFVVPSSTSSPEAFDFKVAGKIANTFAHLKWCKSKSEHVCKWMRALLNDCGDLQVAKRCILEVDQAVAPVVTDLGRVEEKLEIMVARYNQGPAHPHAKSPAALADILRGTTKHNLESIRKEADSIRKGLKKRPNEVKLERERYLKSMSHLTQWALLFREVYQANAFMPLTIQQYIDVITGSRIDEVPEIPKVHPGWTSLPPKLVKDIEKLCNGALPAAPKEDESMKLPPGVDSEKWDLMDDEERDAFLPGWREQFAKLKV